MKITPKKIAMLALLTTLSIVLSFIDNLISVAIPIPLPGFKLGIANLVTLFLVCYFNLGQTLTVVILRCFIASIYGGGITCLLYTSCPS